MINLYLLLYGLLWVLVAAGVVIWSEQAWYRAGYRRGRADQIRGRPWPPWLEKEFQRDQEKLAPTKKRE